MLKNQDKIIQKTKNEAMNLLAQGIITDFTPILEEIKILITDKNPPETINLKIDILLKLLNQLEKFSLTTSKDIPNDN